MLLDINLPDQTFPRCFDGTQKIRHQRPRPFFSPATTRRPVSCAALDMGGDDYITKPFTTPISYRPHQTPCCAPRRVVGRSESHQESPKISDNPFEFCGAHINPARLEITFTCATRSP
jgi:hypothetical protein